MKKRLLLFIALLSITTALGAGPTYYERGDRLISLKGGAVIPLFSYFFSDKDLHTGIGKDNTGLLIGGHTDLNYQVFITSHLALGAEVGYGFNRTWDGLLLQAAPFSATLTYLPLQGQWELPLSLGIGGIYTTLGSTRVVSPFISVEAALIYYPGAVWGVGLSTALHLTAELNTSDELKGDNALLGVLPLTLIITRRW